MKRMTMLWLCLALCGTAAAQTADKVRARTEASTMINGHIVVAPDGSVRTFDLDHQDALPAAVLELVKRNAARWRFEPVVENGAPVTAKAPMHLRVVASPVGDADAFQLRIASATFGDGTYENGLTYKNSSTVLHYPEEAIRAHVTGTVFLAIRVKRDGTVGDVAAEQVNLDQVGAEGILRQWRKVLGDASVRAAQKWTFNPPPGGPHKDDDSWIIRVPITYRLQDTPGSAGAKDGAWQTYVPGPKEPIPWLDDYRRTHKEAGLGVDALPDNGGLYLVGSGLHLTTPLDPS